MTSTKRTAEMNKTEFESSFKKACDFYGFKPNKTQIEVWFDMFKDKPVENFSEALGKYMKYEPDPRFPSIGKITDLIKSTGKRFIPQAVLDGDY
jgi:hypothetical protein